MPITEGDSGANPAQRVGIATTYAKRYSLLGIIGLAPEDDDDTESMPDRDQAPSDDEEKHAPAGADVVISEAQQKRLWAIARAHQWTDEQVKDLFTAFQRDSTKEIRRSEYDGLIDRLKQGPTKAA